MDREHPLTFHWSGWPMIPPYCHKHFEFHWCPDPDPVVVVKTSNDTEAPDGQ